MGVDVLMAMTDAQMERKIAADAKAAATVKAAPVAPAVPAEPAAPTFSKAGTVTNQFGEVVPVDKSGRDENGALVIQASVQPQGPITPAPTGAATSGVDPAIAALQKQIADMQSQINSNTALTAAKTAADQQNAITFLTTTFTDLGLGADIASAVTNLVQQGYTADTIQMIAQDPKSKDPLAVAFQQRFPANAARMAAGLPVLSPSEYIATERSYAQVLGSYGINNNFATNKDVFTKLLTNDISPTELNSRASTAKQVIENTDPAVSQQLQTYYGISQGDMIAHVLDPSIATPIIEQQIATSQIGAEAARAGTNINQSYADQLRSIGVTQSQANQGFQNIAQSQTGIQELATRYDAYGPAGQVGQQIQAATFGTTGAAAATAELNRLKQQEVDQFSGSSGAGKGSLMGTDAGLS